MRKNLSDHDDDLSSSSASSDIASIESTSLYTSGDGHIADRHNESLVEHSLEISKMVPLETTDDHLSLQDFDSSTTISTSVSMNMVMDLQHILNTYDEEYLGSFVTRKECTDTGGLIGQGQKGYAGASVVEGHPD